MRRTIPFTCLALAFGFAIAAACGDAGTTTLDAGDDRADATSETPDAAPETDAPVDLWVPDELPDEPADVPDVGPDGPGDIEPDVVPDGPADVEPDAAPDGPADVEPDAAPDGPADAPADAPADGEAGPGEVRVTMTASDAWANLMPGGSSYHAIFTLEVANGGATDVTGFAVPDGAVSLLAGAATLFSFTRPSLTLAGGGSFDGRVAAGTTVRLEGSGVSSPASSGHCGAEVKVQVRVTWTGGPSAREISGETITLSCVY